MDTSKEEEGIHVTPWEEEAKVMNRHETNQLLSMYLKGLEPGDSCPNND